MFKTYQTKIKNDEIVLFNEENTTLYDFLEEYAKEFGKIERKLFVDLYVKGKNSNALKTSYCAKFNITARQYNSIKNQLDGRVKAFEEKRKYDLNELKDKIKQLEQKIEKKEEDKTKKNARLGKMKGDEKTFEKLVRSYRKLKRSLHFLKRKLHRLKQKLEKVESDVQNKTVRLCFGSKKIFHKQFYLEENKITFEEWKQEWQKSRMAQMTMIGSKDETYGNQSCTYDKENNVRVRVMNKFEEKYGKYITIPNITFAYGQENLDKAKEMYVGTTKGGNIQKYFRAITAKFIRMNDNWYLNMSVDVDLPETDTIEGNGSIGVDFNVGFLAVTETDRFGNPIHSFQVPYKANHVSSEQTEQTLSNALKVVVEYAKKQQKPLIYEDLDFKQKKKSLKDMKPKQAKMLSGLAYSKYKDLLVSKCEKYGVRHEKVKPAYTSQIGHHKFMKRYGLSSHCSAALVIARRSMNFKHVEQVPYSHILEDKKEKIIAKPRINQWREVTKQWKKYTFSQKMHLLYKGI